MLKPLTERDIDTLAELDAHHSNMANLNDPDRGARPLDVGGGNGSHHSATLKKLADRGLVRRKKYGGAREKGSCLYWITDAGRDVLRECSRLAMTAEERRAQVAEVRARRQQS